MGKYIFPGADASCPLGWVIEQLEGGGFEIRSEETIGIHYSATIRCWLANWLRPQVAQEIQKKYGVRMYRLWAWFLAWSVISPEQVRFSSCTRVTHLCRFTRAYSTDDRQTETQTEREDGAHGHTHTQERNTAQCDCIVLSSCSPFRSFASLFPGFRELLPDRCAQEHASLQPQAVHRRARKLADLKGGRQDPDSLKTCAFGIAANTVRVFPSCVRPVWPFRLPFIILFSLALFSFFSCVSIFFRKSSLLPFLNYCTCAAFPLRSCSCSTGASLTHSLLDAQNEQTMTLGNS